MTPTRRKATIAAAIVAAMASGALAGDWVGSTKILYHGTAPASSNVGYSEDASDGYAPDAPAPPDHYPLVTRSGTIPVAELALHGRLRSMREPEWLHVVDRGPVPEWTDAISERELAALAEWDPSMRESSPSRRKPTSALSATERVTPEPETAEIPLPQVALAD